MGVVPLVIEEIPIKIELLFCGRDPILRFTFVFVLVFPALFFWIELVALVEATRLISMERPRTITDPAELILTRPAGHMVAPLILLDTGAAFGTLFRVDNNPMRCQTLCFALLQPFLQLRTGYRGMAFFVALEAETKATQTFDRGDRVRDHRRLVTTGRGAPTHASILLYERLEQ